MNKVVGLAFILLPVLAAAQDVYSQAEARLYGVNFLSTVPVQRELNLTNWQKTRLAILSEQRMRGPNLTTDAGRAAFSADEDRRAAILAPWQKERLKQISLQIGGLTMVANPWVRQELGITQTQRDTFDAIYEEYKKEHQRLFATAETAHARGPAKAANDAIKEYGLSSAAALREAGKKMFAVLNADQQKKWVSMVGKPFSWGADQAKPPGAPPFVGKQMN